MSRLIEIIEDEARVSHRVIAESTSNRLQSIQDLITRNISDFQEFGALEAEEKKVTNSVGAINIQKTYFLNEPQATLLMTYLRNSEIVKEFKKKLVKAFFAMKQERETVPHANMDVFEVVRVLVQNQTIMMQQQQMLMDRLEVCEKQPAQIAPMSLVPEQLGKIRGAVNMATEAVLEYCFNDTEANVQQLIYKKLNNLLGTPSYIYIPASAFDEAMEFLKSIELKHTTLTEQRRERDKNIRASINNDSFEFPQF